MNLILRSCRKVYRSISRQTFHPQSITSVMDMDHHLSKNELLNLSKEELVDKIEKMQKECKSLRESQFDPVSKYGKMKQKFDNAGKKRKKKDFNPALCGQRKVALKVAYFGWDFMGLQSNPGLDDTIEKILFEALFRTKLLLTSVEESNYTRCGRTDKGVSAFSQVVCLNLRSKVIPPPKAAEEGETSSETNCENNKEKSMSNFGEIDYCKILNNVLPKEIRVLAWAAINDESFSARRSCTGRKYRYYFPRGSLNIEKMNEAAQLLEGSHDFRNVCRMNVSNTTNFVRRITHFSIHCASGQPLCTEDDPYQMCYAEIHGNAFLYHQVRYMMSVLFLIGMGFEEPTVITDLLDVDKMPKKPQFGMMADYPLVLYDCQFDGVEWNTSTEVSNHLLSSFQKFWCTLSIKTEMAKSMLHKYLVENRDIVCLGKDFNTELPFSMTSIKNYDINGHLLSEKFSTTKYKKLVDRETCLSLEEQVENMERRKRRKTESLKIVQSD